MNTSTTAIELSVGACRRALCALADDYIAEANSNDRPITTALPALLPGVCAFYLPSDTAVALFDEFARARAVSGLAEASYDEIDAAEVRAEALLERLVGEAL